LMPFVMPPNRVPSGSLAANTSENEAEAADDGGAGAP
jgi:hypothetical protein